MNACQREMLFLFLIIALAERNGECQILQVKYIPGVYIISSLGGGPNVSEGVFAVNF